jgi:hypothetical protein
MSGGIMRKWFFLATGLLAGTHIAAVHASSVDLNVILSGEIKPGVYGRVEIGNTPPPVYYPEPIIIVKQSRPVSMAPVYLNVPPGHAKNWRKHCSKYDACGKPVYFVRTEEYDPDYRPHKKGKHKNHHDDSDSDD